MNLSELLYFVEHQTVAMINVDSLNQAFYSMQSLSMAPEQHVHRGKYCEFAKRHSLADLPCSENKKKSRIRAKKGRAFESICQHGIWELVWPVMDGARLEAILYFSHFSTSKLRKEIGGAGYSGPVPERRSSTDRKALRRYAEFISEYIRIEIVRWNLEGNGIGKHKEGPFYREFCHEFIEKNYRNEIKLTDLAETLRMSPNYLSEKIKKECGKTFSQLLTEKRIEVTCTYLDFELDANITDIAYMCGFLDSNYFSTVFRKVVGMSPRQYRKESTHFQQLQRKFAN